MRSLFSLLICFFVGNIYAAPTLKRLCITSQIQNHEPTNHLDLKDIKNQKFYIFIELDNCDKSKFFLKLTTSKGTLKRTFYTQKNDSFRTSCKFANVKHVKNIEVTDAAGNVIGEPIINTNQPADKKSHKKKTRGMKKLLQSMQDKK